MTCVGPAGTAQDLRGCDGLAATQTILPACAGPAWTHAIQRAVSYTTQASSRTRVDPRHTMTGPHRFLMEWTREAPRMTQPFVWRGSTRVLRRSFAGSRGSIYCLRGGEAMTGPARVLQVPRTWRAALLQFVQLTVV